MKPQTVVDLLNEQAKLAPGKVQRDMWEDAAKTVDALIMFCREMQTWKLSAPDSARFVDNVLNPPEPNAALKEAAARRRANG